MHEWMWARHFCSDPDAARAFSDDAPAETIVAAAKIRIARIIISRRSASTPSHAPLLFAQLKEHAYDRQTQGYECQPHENDRHPGLQLLRYGSHTHVPSGMPGKSGRGIRSGSGEPNSESVTTH